MRHTRISLYTCALAFLTPTLVAISAQAQNAGTAAFTQHCASCHGTDGNGGELGPNITSRVPLRTDDEPCCAR
jgi:mono/diheme cytochrome c family protein